MTHGQRSRLAALALFCENRVFPLVFGYFALVHVRILIAFHGQVEQFLRTFWRDGIDGKEANFVLFLLIRFLLILLNTGFAAALLRRTRRDHDFDDWREVVVPLATTGYSFIGGAIMYSHSRLNVELLPRAYASVLASAGMTVVVVGILISVLATWQLRRSFSVYVESHPVVDSGIYRFSRHPMYVGHGVRLLGYCLMNGYLLYVLVSLGTLALLAYRAVLEERRLLRTEPRYARYRRLTPSLLLDRLAPAGRRASPAVAEPLAQEAAA